VEWRGLLHTRHVRLRRVTFGIAQKYGSWIASADNFMTMPAPSSAQILQRLEHCCICLGYLQDSARFEQKDQVQPDTAYLVDLLRANDPQANEQLLKLATEHTNPWVTYYVFVNIWKQYPAQAVLAFRRLISAEGMVSPGAMMALHAITGSINVESGSMH
jgi:hypothetical protein